MAIVVGLGVCLLGNQALERATLGHSLRAERATYSTASTTGTAPGTRVQEAALTAVGLFPNLDRRSYAIGGAVLGLLLVLARASASRARAGLAAVGAAGLVVLYAVRFADGFGFVPGLIASTPLAAVGLAWAARRVEVRLVAAVALVSLPLVWAFQFPGGAPPQWGGRYILASGFLLGVLGVAALGLLAGWARVFVVGLSAGGAMAAEPCTMIASSFLRNKVRLTAGRFMIWRVRAAVATVGM